MQNAESIEILRERKREYNLEKVSFLCDAKNNIKEYIKKVNLKADYLSILKKVKFLMLKGSLFFE